MNYIEDVTNKEVHMINYRQKDNRGLTETSWLQSQHSFSFGEYHDPNNMGFGPLRVINEDFVRPGAGFHTHGHSNMEIITYVIAGAVEHKDNLGSGGVIRPGDIQMMSAGKGILHSEFNPSPDEEVHLLQIWIMPNERGTKPTYQQTRFDAKAMHNRWQLIVSPDGADGSLKILQDAKVWSSRLDKDATLDIRAEMGRKYWLQVARGSLTTGDHRLTSGDALTVDQENTTVTLKAGDDSEVLLFELNA
jgi:redox-sensitive bicupin YhaK (pirin superfamily)